MSRVAIVADFESNDGDLQTVDVQQWQRRRPSSPSFTLEQIDHALARDSISYRLPRNQQRYTRVASLLEGQPYLCRYPRYQVATDRVLRILRPIYSSASVLPTPQPSVNIDGTIEVSWLVDETIVTLTVGTDHEGFIAARGPLASSIDDQEFRTDWEPLSEVLQSKLARLLHEMGNRVMRSLDV